jgi:hypothetical protein
MNTRYVFQVMLWTKVGVIWTITKTWVGLERILAKRRGSGLSRWEAHPDPVVKDGQRGALSTDPQRKDFGAVAPWDGVQAGSERDHVLYRSWSVSGRKRRSREPSLTVMKNAIDALAVALPLSVPA